VTRLVCATCTSGYPVDPATWQCPCGGVLDLEGRVEFDPIDIGHVPTPLVTLSDDTLDLRLKLEGALPTGSFKDRGSAWLVGMLAAHGVRRAVADSSGNAGASLAAHCARAGITLDLFVPQHAAAGKLVQAITHGARLHRIDGPRQAAADAAARAVADGGVYATHAWSPLFVEGTRSFGQELIASLQRDPDAVVFPVGSGTLLLGAWRELAAHCDTPPRLYAIQSAACTPLADAFAAGEPTPRLITPTASVAEGVLVGRPPRGAQVLDAVRRSGGAVIAVDDTLIPPALRRLAHGGVFAEPTAALAIAGIETLQRHGLLGNGELVVAAVTAHGLKAPDAIRMLLDETAG
jgi:threonine synthase